MTRDRTFAIGASMAVAAALVLGFMQLGSPGKQRLMEADRRRVQDLRRISIAVHDAWATPDNKLPTALSELPASSVPRDPLTKNAYEYRVTGASTYRLCATFALDNQQGEENRQSPEWQHPAGYHCFSKDASKGREPFF